jgi:hypothetical protein
MLQQCTLRFSSLAAHRAAAVVLSPDRLTVSQTSNKHAWVRCERGFAPGCGAVKWVVKLGDGDGGQVYLLAVVSDAFTEYTRYHPSGSWCFQDDTIWADGKQQGSYSSYFFDSGDVVSVELERRPGQDGVMRVRVAGKAPKRDMTGLPRDGMLYPAVCLLNHEQSYTMLPRP